MSFSFQVSGHAGPGVAPTDEDEGERVKRFVTALLKVGVYEGLNVSTHSYSPPRWAPETQSAFVGTAAVNGG